MKHRIKNTLRGLAQHLGLKIRFVDYLPDNIHGKLLPREKRILINARKPRPEHFYTVLHEIGHFLVHVKSLPKKRHPRIFDVNWKVEKLRRLWSRIRRTFRFWVNSQAGKEWDADLWAMCAYVYLARVIGCRGELLAFLNRHPEKTRFFLLAVYGSVHVRTKETINRFTRAVAKAFHLIRNFATA